MPQYPVTPDGRYFVVKGRLWRCTNPSLPLERQQQLVNELMAAKRAVKAAKAAQDDEALRQARREVYRIKVELGERGAVWWVDGAPDLNRYLVSNSEYSEWYEAFTNG